MDARYVVFSTACKFASNLQCANPNVLQQLNVISIEVIAITCNITSAIVIDLARQSHKAIPSAWCATWKMSLVSPSKMNLLDRDIGSLICFSY